MVISFALLSTFRNFALYERELTPSRQKKENLSFVLLSTFRNFAVSKPNHYEKNIFPGSADIHHHAGKSTNEP